MKPFNVNVSDELIFIDRLLPPRPAFEENIKYSKSYFVNLHLAVKAYETHNFLGARIPLEHNNINVKVFRFYLSRFDYPYIHLMQFVEFGFPLGLWPDICLVPCTNNHSSAYSYYSYIDEFVAKELKSLGLTGPFSNEPFEQIMLSPLMTAHKKPNSRRAVFDASFGLFSLNKNTPEGAYHETQYEFTFPRVDDLADLIAKLGRGCFLFKRDLSRYFLQLKIDPSEYDKLGFVWRGLVFFFVSFVWGCWHAGYCGQWVTSAVSFIHSNLGLEESGECYNLLNYADDFAGAESSFEKASNSFNTLGRLLLELGLIESTSKAISPSTEMVYLGVKFNTVDMCMYVDEEKVIELKCVLHNWSRKTVANKSDLQSILGKLLWVSKTVRFSRVFVSRIIAEIKKLPKQSSKTKLSNEIRKDFLWWETYLQVFSGVEFIPPTTVCQTVLGDAYPQGGGSWNPVRNEYFSLQFPQYMCSAETPIHIKEFIVVILSVRLWGNNWSGQRILIHCDNDSVCDTCTRQKPNDVSMQKLLREFLYWVCKYNFYPILQKISSKENHIADFISRNHDQDDISSYFIKNGYLSQKQLLIPDSWFNFVAEW